MKFGKEDPVPHTDGSTDASNVSHVIPVLHPFYGLDTSAFNHTKEFLKVAGTADSYERTLVVARVMALTVLELIRSSDTLNEVKEEFKSSEMTQVTSPMSKL